MEIDPDSLGGFIDWNEDNILENLSAILQFDSQDGFPDANLTEPSNFPTLQTQNIEEPVTELATAPKPPVVGSSISSSHETAAAPTFVPNPLLLSVPNSSASLLNETPSNHPLSSAVGLNLEGAVSSRQGQDVTQAGCFNQFSDMQNENFYAFQGIGYDEHTPRNPPLVPNVIENNNFSGVNNPLPPYTATFHPNPVQARQGIETGHSSGQIVTSQTPAFFPLDNHISNAHSAWNPRWPENQISAPNVHGSQYAANYSQSPQLFSTLQNQVGHASETQNVFGLQSQNSMPPVFSVFPRSEQYSTLQSSFVTMPPNPFQHEYRPELPEPVAPSASSFANYGQRPSLFATTTNSFASGSSLPPAYPPLYENQGYLNQPQVKMPNVHGQQSGASGQLWSQRGVADQINEYSRGINTPNLQRKRNTLHEPTVQTSSFTSSQALSSTGILRLSSTRATEGTSSQLSNPREAEIARLSSLPGGNQVVAAPANEVPTQRDKGKLPGSSSTRSQPSEAIRRILNMNPTRTVTHNSPIQHNGRGSRTYDLGRQLSSLREGHYQPPRRGRPPKRRDPEDLSSRRGKKASSETGKARATPTPQEAQNTPAIVANRDLNAIPANPAAPRQYVNTVYDHKFERNGKHIDPHLRLFKPPPRN